MTPLTSPGPPHLVDEQLFVFLLRANPPRIHEALWIAERALYSRMALSAANSLQRARMDDDRLEEAVVLRDTMRRHQRSASLRDALLGFLDKYPNITYIPLIRPHRGMEACAIRALLAVASLGGAEEVFRNISGLQRIVQIVAQLALTAEQLVLSTASENISETLLHSALIDLSRFALHVSVVGSYTLDAPAASFVVELLHMVRSTAVHKVPDNIRASVSLICAELLAFYDTKLPKTVTIPPIERRCHADEPCCYLTGTCLANTPRGTQCGDVTVTAASGAYWGLVAAPS
jgi:hypothetical protein